MGGNHNGCLSPTKTPPASAIQGCSPGYWKEHPTSWNGTPPDLTTTVQTTDKFNQSFLNVAQIKSGLADTVTLLQALNPTTPGSTELSRLAAAELANADALGANHPYTLAQVIAIYRDAVGADPGAETIVTATNKFKAAQKPTVGVVCPLD